MRKSAGFTLIELVIVIVILGILGAVAAPKFLNLQGDAYGANVASMAGSIQTAATLANTKAILEGVDSGTGKAVKAYPDVLFNHGYPQAKTDHTGILGALQTVPKNDEDYKIAQSVGIEGAALAVTLQPKSRADTDPTKADQCYVRYTEATKDTAAKVEFDADCG